MTGDPTGQQTDDMRGPPPGWREHLEAVRRTVRDVPDPVWDDHWCRWWRVAVRSGRTPNAAIEVAWTRTKAQHGPRPETPKETQK